MKAKKSIFFILLTVLACSYPAGTENNEQRVQKKEIEIIEKINLNQVKDFFQIYEPYEKKLTQFLLKPMGQTTDQLCVSFKSEDDKYKFVWKSSPTEYTSYTPNIQYLSEEEWGKDITEDGPVNDSIYACISPYTGIVFGYLKLGRADIKLHSAVRINAFFEAMDRLRVWEKEQFIPCNMRSLCFSNLHLLYLNNENGQKVMLYRQNCIKREPNYGLIIAEIEAL